MITNRTGIKYIKIHRKDSAGNDNTLTLEGLKNIRIVHTDIGVVNYPVYNISEYPNYYLYQVFPTDITSSIDYTGSNNLVILEPYLITSFEYNDHNSVGGIIDGYPSNNNIMEVDFSIGGVFPINQDQIIGLYAFRSSVKDYYYNLNRHINPRYKGSKVQSLLYNVYSPAELKYTSGSGKDSLYEGDIAYGKSPNILSLGSDIFEFNWGGSTYPEIPNGGAFEMGNILEVTTAKNVNTITPAGAYKAYSYIIDDTFYPNKKINPKPIQYETKVNIQNDLRVITTNFVTPAVSSYWIPTNTSLGMGAKQIAGNIQLNNLYEVVKNSNGQYTTGSLSIGSVVGNIVSQSINKGEKWFVTILGQETSTPNTEFLPCPLIGSLLPYNYSYEEVINTDIGYEDILAHNGVYGISMVSGSDLLILNSELLYDYGNGTLEMGSGTYGTLSYKRKGMLLWKAHIPEENKNKYIIISGLNSMNNSKSTNDSSLTGIGKGAIILPDSNDAIKNNFNEITTTFGTNTKPPSLSTSK